MASVAFHMLALLVLGSEFGARFQSLIGPRGQRDPVIEVRLLRWRDGDFRVHLSPDQPAPLPTPAPAPRSPPADEPSLPLPVTVQAVASLPDDPGSVDVDGLYSAPFVDAAAQAYASLRGGLGCAHVDLDALPGSLRALCEAARSRETRADVTVSQIRSGPPPSPASPRAARRPG